MTSDCLGNYCMVMKQQNMRQWDRQNNRLLWNWIVFTSHKSAVQLLILMEWRKLACSLLVHIRIIISAIWRKILIWNIYLGLTQFYRKVQNNTSSTLQTQMYIIVGLQEDGLAAMNLHDYSFGLWRWKKNVTKSI